MTIAKLRDTLRWVVDDVQEWCDAIAADASWDGWDSHYKSFAYGGLDKARAVLNELERQLAERKEQWYRPSSIK